MLVYKILLNSLLYAFFLIRIRCKRRTKRFLCSNDVKEFLKAIEGLESDNSFVCELLAQAEEIKSDETWRETYMQSLLRDQDKFDSGFDSGVEVERIKIAKSLLQDGMPLENISKCTELPIEEVKKLCKI